MVEEGREQDEFRRLRDWFDTLIELPPSERAAALEHLDTTPDVRAQLRKFLGLYEQYGQATARAALAGLRSRPTSSLVGQRIGNFLLERELGHGGMGSVYLAHRADGSVEQKVALKLIRPEQIEPSMLMRFRLERQVLALLKHPNVAALFDLGETDDGLPYAVMEYVEGEPITTFCTVHALDRASRLRLFLQVCEAVGYAHRNMVVHRDIKPSNILVTLDGHPKLLDFGIAKPLLQRFGTQEINETGIAHRFFSPQNAAPEQVRGEPVSVACDVYGLGALLYELLAEQPPFDFAGKTPGEIEHTILHVDPIAPSVRAADKSLQGDLDAIVLRALRKQPEQRYVTVEQLQDDVQRYLTNRPVLARKGRTSYRVRKFMARHRVALGVGVAFALLLTASGIVLWREALEALHQRDRAQHATTFLVEAFRAADPEKALGEKTTAKQIVDQAQRSLQAELSEDPELRLELLSRIAEIEVHLKAYDAARTTLAQALAIYAATPLDDPAIGARLFEQQAIVLTNTGSEDDAKQALEKARSLDGDRTMAAQLETDTLELLFMQGATKELEPHIERALTEIAPRLPADDPARWSLLVEVAKTDLGIDRARAGVTLLEGLLRDTRLPAVHPLVIAAKSQLVNEYKEAQRADDARKLLESIKDDVQKLYGERSLPMASWRNNMAAFLLAEGNYDAAREMYLNVLATYQEMFGPESRRAANTYFNLAENESEAKQYAAAEKYYRASIEIAPKVFAATNENVEMFRTAFALMLNKQQRFDEARPLFSTVLARAESEPEFLKEDVYKAAVIGGAVADFAAAPNAAHQERCAQVLATYSADGGPELKQIVDEQTKIAATAGFKAAPTPPPPTH